MAPSHCRYLIIIIVFMLFSQLSMPIAAQDDRSDDDIALTVICPGEEFANDLLESIKANHPGHENPPIKGLRWHRNEYFSFFVPISWQQSDWDDGRTGVIYRPAPDDPLTLFAVDIRDLDTVVSLQALDRLDAEFIDTIEQREEGTIELHDQAVVGELMRLEYTFTFYDDCIMRKRWVRVLYQGTRQITLTAQGSTLAMYDYWKPWFFEAMATAQVHDQKPTIASLD